MNSYKAVRSSLDISKSIVSGLELFDPAAFRQVDRAGSIKGINDILQSRSEKSTEELLSELAQKGGDGHAKEVAALRQDVQDFLHQKELLTKSYGMSRDTEYDPLSRMGRPSRKVIDQKSFDRAAERGFPPCFFRNSYFDHVTIYCMPDGTDGSFSEFRNCTFAVCRIRDASFFCSSIWDSEFHSSAIYSASFVLASLAHTHFHDCTLRHSNFNRASMKSCNFIDSLLDHINFNYATMDSCAFGRVSAEKIWNLDRATITQGGATQEECQQNREAIFRALGVEQ